MVSVSQLVELWIMLNKWFNTIFNICVINIDSGAYNSERFPLWICLCTLWFILFFYCRGQLYTEMLIFKSIFLNSTIVLRNQFGTKMDYAFPLNQVCWCCKLWEYKNTIGMQLKWYKMCYNLKGGFSAHFISESLEHVKCSNTFPKARLIIQTIT